MAWSYAGRNLTQSRIDFSPNLIMQINKQHDWSTILTQHNQSNSKSAFMPFFFIKGEKPTSQCIYQKDRSHSLFLTLISNTHSLPSEAHFTHLVSEGMPEPKPMLLIKYNIFILEQRPHWQHGEANALIYTTDNISMQKLRRLGGSLSSCTTQSLPIWLQLDP